MVSETTITVDIPKGLLPDILEVVTNAYIESCLSLERKGKRISDLEFENSSLRNLNSNLGKELADARRRADANF